MTRFLNGRPLSISFPTSLFLTVTTHGNCCAPRELKFSFGKLHIHVSAHQIDTKSNAHGFVYLHHAAVYATERWNPVTCYNIIPFTDIWAEVLEAFNWQIVLPRDFCEQVFLLLFFGRYGMRETLNFFWINSYHPEMFLIVLSSKQSFGVNLYWHFKAVVFPCLLQIGNILYMPYNMVSLCIPLDMSFDRWHWFLSEKDV